MSTPHYISVTVLCSFLGLAGFVLMDKKKDLDESHEKIKGISLVAPAGRISSDAMVPLKRINSEWVCVLPYAFAKKEGLEIIDDHPRQWWGETTSGIASTIQHAQDHDLKVLVKPHLWMSDGSYTGHFRLTLDQNWEIWEKNYRKYILTYARIADSMEVEMFCVGNELKIFVAERPQFFSDLVDSIRTFYQGKLVYGSNWDDYQTVPFWGKLDYIGINAYFPLVDSETPKVDELILKWAPIKKDIHKCFKKNWRPIIFTEFGYRSINHTADRPWESYGHSKVNLEAQKNAYLALLTSFWGESWFQGGFAWSWFMQHDAAGGEKDIDYTPQNKPAEEVLKYWFEEK